MGKNRLVLTRSFAQQSPLVSGRGAGGRRDQHNRLGLGPAASATLRASSLSSHITDKRCPYTVTHEHS
ncbi:unnamed protein product, partial [Iphiclides podalirius]